MYTKSPRDTYIVALSTNDIGTVEQCLTINKVSPNIRIDKELNTALHYAVQVKNKDLVHLLLKNKINVTLKNKAGLTAIQLGGFFEADECLSIMANFCLKDDLQLESADLALLRAFSSKEEKMQPITPSKRDAFIEAVNKADLMQVKACLDSGVSVNIRIDKEFNTALHKAIKLQNKELVALLLLYHPNFNLLNKNQATPIQLASDTEAWGCHQMIFEFIHASNISSSSANIESKNQTDSKPIKQLSRRDAYKKAVTSSDLAEVAELLKAGVSVNIVVDDELNTILHIGVKSKNLELIHLALQHGVSVSRKNKHGNTAIELAIANQAWDCIKTIAENSVVNIEEIELYDTAMLAAIRAHQVDVVRALINAGASMHYFTTNAGEHYLKNLIARKQQDMIAALSISPIIKNLIYLNAICDNNYIYVEDALKKKAFFINDRLGVNEDTGLHLAIFHKKEQLVKLFLNQNISLNLKNKSGLTALELAVQLQYWDSIKIILEHHHLNISNSAQYPFVLMQALKTNQLDIVSILLKAGITMPVDYLETKESTHDFQRMVDNKWDDMINLLLTGSSEFRMKFGTLPAPIKEYFEELILQEELTEPVLTRQGTTYNKKDLMGLVVDPINRAPLNHLELVPNLLVYDLLSYYKLPNVNSSQMPLLLICPETNAAYKEPVVSGEGITYEKSWITNYLAKTRNTTPTGYQQPVDRPLYENRLVKTLIEEKYSPEKMLEEINREKYKSAMEKRDLKGIEDALKAKISPNICVDEKRSNTGLHQAVESKDIELINLLLRYGASLTIPNKAGLTPMKLAIVTQAWGCIQEIAVGHPNDKSALSQYDIPLIPTLRANQIDVARALLKAGAPMTYFTVPEGEEFFKELIDHNQQEIINLLVMEGRPLIINSLLLKFGNLSEEIKEYFVDNLVSFEEIEDPVISPTGTTYDKKIAAGFQKEPLSNKPIEKTDLIPNLLVLDLLAYYKQPGVDLSKIPPCLICKDTNRIFEKPVVAADGITYEEMELIKYLTAHGNLTPKAAVQETKPYVNLLVKNLITEMYNQPATKEQNTSSVRVFGFFAPLVEEDNKPHSSKMEYNKYVS